MNKILKTSEQQILTALTNKKWYDFSCTRNNTKIRAERESKNKIKEIQKNQLTPIAPPDGTIITFKKELQKINKQLNIQDETKTEIKDVEVVVSESYVLSL